MRREAAEANQEYEPVKFVRRVGAFTYDHLIKFTRELQDKHIAVIKQDVTLKRFLLEYDKTLIELLRKLFGAHDPVQVRDELTEVQNGVLADVGKYVTGIYTALQSIQLPDDALNLVKALLKELAKTAPHLAGAFTADATWYPNTIEEYIKHLLEMAKGYHESAEYFSDWMTPLVEEGRPTTEQYNKVCQELKRLKSELIDNLKNRPESQVQAQRRAAHDPGEGSTVRGKGKADPELYQLRQDRPHHQQLLEKGLVEPTKRIGCLQQRRSLSRSSTRPT